MKEALCEVDSPSFTAAVFVNRSPYLFYREFPMIYERFAQQSPQGFRAGLLTTLSP